MLIDKQKILSIIEDDLALSSLIKNFVGTAESGEFHFELPEGVDQYIISRFKTNLDKAEFNYHYTLNRPGIKLTMSVQQPAPAPVVIPEPVVESEPVEEEVIEAQEEQEPKRKTRK